LWHLSTTVIITVIVVEDKKYYHINGEVVYHEPDWISWRSLRTCLLMVSLKGVCRGKDMKNVTWHILADFSDPRRDGELKRSTCYLLMFLDPFIFKNCF
jgi:hypothetical protein